MVLTYNSQPFRSRANSLEEMRCYGNQMSNFWDKLFSYTVFV